MPVSKKTAPRKAVKKAARTAASRKSELTASRSTSQAKSATKATAKASSRSASKSAATKKATAKSTNAKQAASNGSSNLSRTTVDHDEIRQWAEARDAKPAHVKGTGRKGSEIGMIRLDFPGYSGAESLEEITWEQFFEQFEKNALALVYQETTAEGAKSNFNKLVSRES